MIRDARKLGVHPGYALGRDYPGMDDVLLVCLTEKRSAADIDRLAEVLRRGAGGGGMKLIYEKSRARPAGVADRRSRRAAGGASRPSSPGASRRGCPSWPSRS